MNASTIDAITTEVVHAHTNPFPVLTIADDPTMAQYLHWLRGVIKAFENWGEPELDDITEYGSFVRNAGLLAVCLGFDELFAESLNMAPMAPQDAFGIETPVCSQEDAYLFFGKCIGKVVRHIRKECTVGIQTPTASPAKNADNAKCIDDNNIADDGEMPPRFAHALEWERQAKIRNGNSYPDTYVYAWAKRNTASYDLPLPNNYKTFARYLRGGREFLESAKGEAVDAVARKAMRGA